jgi:hypothetical protein
MPGQRQCRTRCVLSSPRPEHVIRMIEMTGVTGCMRP